MGESISQSKQTVMGIPQEGAINGLLGEMEWMEYSLQMIWRYTLQQEEV